MDKHRGLTRRQQQVLGFIRQRQQGGCPPTIREIARHFGWSSPHAAFGHVRALEAKGHIERDPRKARGIRVTSDRVAPPPLQVAIYRMGKFVRFIERPDWRIAFCKTYNEAAAGTGLRAEIPPNN
ncbi:MAG: MarR family transcriptional regulator [bacterium]|nr:MarR family transcriptional regulator [bacterium]